MKPKRTFRLQKQLLLAVLLGVGALAGSVFGYQALNNSPTQNPPTATRSPEGLLPTPAGLLNPAELPDEASLPEQKTILRWRAVRINFELIQSAENQPPINLNLFDDTALTAIFDRLETRGANSYTWFGHIQDNNRSLVTLTVENGILAGSVMMPGAVYQIRYFSGEVYIVEEINQAALPR